MLIRYTAEIMNGIVSEEKLFEVCFRGQGVEMQLPDSVIEECFDDAIEWI